MRRFSGLAVGLLAASLTSADEFHVYYLGGQSNMDGFGKIRELPASDQGVVDGVWIFHGNPALDDKPAAGDGLWSELRPGHGTGFSSDGATNTYSDSFGPEVTFGQEIQALYPDRRIALVKYSLGGTALQEGIPAYGTWAPDYAGTNQYDHALATIAKASARRDIDGDGEADTLIPAGIVWMQGEADAYQSYDAALAYESNLKRLMGLLRAAWRDNDLPVVIGRITDSGRADDGNVMDHIKIVQEAQRRFVASDRCAAYSTITDQQAYPPDDAWHYESAAYLAMGLDFARLMKRLDVECASPDRE
ncbi:MAG: sialate O-acetylesterase [Pseudomonadota bacterium]